MNKIIVGSEGKGDWSSKLTNYLLKLAYPNMEIEWKNTEDCDIIIRSHFFNIEKQWTNKKIPYILWSGEKWSLPVKSYLPIVSLQTVTRDKNEYHNYFHIPYVYDKYDLKMGSTVRKYPVSKYIDFENKRPYMVAYCNSAQILEREKMFKLLQTIDKTGTVHGLGKCSNTMGGKLITGDWSSDVLIDTYSKYRFVFAMENKCVPGYVTEKILNAFVSGAIPIYWGDSYVKKLFNERAFIYVNDFSSFEECAKYIIELGQDVEKMRSMMMEPVFKDNIVPDILKIGEFNDVPKVYRKISDNIKRELDKFEKFKTQNIISNVVKSYLESHLIESNLITGSKNKYTFITGADESHYETLRQFLFNIKKYENKEENRIIVYDLGLHLEHLNELKTLFPNYIYKIFDYSKYPKYFNIRINAGEYAWKPTIIKEVCEKYGNIVIWVDAGTLFTKSQDNLKRILNNDYIFTPLSCHTIEKWTHPKTLQYMNWDSLGLDLKLIPRAGGFFGINYNISWCKEFVGEWARLAKIKECIAPEGSSRENHRQDQSILSILYYQYQKKYGFKMYNHADCSYFNDIDR